MFQVKVVYIYVFEGEKWQTNLGINTSKWRWNSLKFYAWFLEVQLTRVFYIQAHVSIMRPNLAYDHLARLALALSFSLQSEIQNGFAHFNAAHSSHYLGLFNSIPFGPDPKKKS